MATTTPARAARACGLDFGTSNSTLAVIEGGAPRLVPLEGEAVAIPSAIFYGMEPRQAFLIGREAVEAYVDGAPGRLMRSLKSILGSSLIEEKTAIHKARVSFKSVVARYERELKRRAEARLDHGLDRVVHGRPVHFVDGDAAADARAEATLAEIARGVGFSEVSFQFEPVAAAFDFERVVAGETLALIADIGGGTSDFTVVRLSPERARAEDRSGDILANAGLRLGGTDYDRQLSMAAVMPALGLGTRQLRGDLDLPVGPYYDLSTWAMVHVLYEAKAMAELKGIRRVAARPDLVDRLIRLVEAKRGHAVLIGVEAAKITLSEAAETAIDLGFVENGLAVPATRAGFEEASAKLRDRLTAAAVDCVARAGLKAAAIDAIFFTGGTSQVPAVRRAIRAAAPDARVVDGDRFGAVGLGLALEARRRYG
jgi:hypothetical chaperone protein